MFKVYKKEIEVAGKKISLETGKVARQADGAIIASCGETVILATVVGAKKVNPDMDYFPLSVNYQEKYYAGGKIDLSDLCFLVNLKMRFSCYQQ
jgi:polyribonucleotide nucleotidyltransferase